MNEVKRRDLLLLPIAKHEAEESDVTRRLNEVYAHVDSSLDPIVRRAQLRSLEREDW